ncbi:MAG: tRNA (adenosine(37)-N6)-threonylcarbamoyltransferase complex dimerization subunit type 1 TsaB [Chitinispirillaceae bacterium]|nr:tRNA (adenosine(37)-N6)-threonylcarbamoyltransferase complex dimerization subunit type 1 TsaB [Chitinispirillaceae bacterium]
MSVVLGIDTSSTDLSVGIYNEDSPAASYSRYIGNSHAEHIAPVIGMMLGANGFSPETVERIAVATGPGSFTGLRIGIAFVKGFCIGNPVPVLPVSSLHILAHTAIHHAGRIIAAIDARNNDVFWAAFTVGHRRFNRLSDDAVSPSSRFYDALVESDIVVTDTVGYRKSTVFSNIPDYCTVLPVENNPLQRGLICASLGAEMTASPDVWCKPVDIHPNYLRRSAPEERLGATGGK